MAEMEDPYVAFRLMEPHALSLWESNTATALTKGVMFSCHAGTSQSLWEKAIREEKFSTPNVNLIFPTLPC